MKYLPLVWAALGRNRTETLLTLLALTAAFTLFGSMLALNAAFVKAVGDIRMDRLFVVCRFDCSGLPMGYEGQLRQVKGVIGVGATRWLWGYQRDPTHRVGVSFVDEGVRAGWPELPLRPADWGALSANPDGIFLSRSAAARHEVARGGKFALVTESGSRADGNNTWFFTVLGIVDDPPGWSQGPQDVLYGNFRYLEESRPLDQRGLGGTFRVAVDDAAHARDICRQITRMYANSPAPVFCVPAREDAEELAAANIDMRQLSLGVAAAGLFMIVFLCANGIAESVRERLPELGTLKTLGYGDERIAALVFVEAAVPTLLAAFLGTACAWMLCRLATALAVKGTITLPPTPMSVAVFALALAAALLVALASSTAPLLRIRRMELASIMAGR